MVREAASTGFGLLVGRENPSLSSLLLLLGILLGGGGLEEVLAVLLGLEEGIAELVGICRKRKRVMLVIVKCVRVHKGLHILSELANRMARVTASGSPSLTSAAAFHTQLRSEPTLGDRVISGTTAQASVSKTSLTTDKGYEEHVGNSIL